MAHTDIILENKLMRLTLGEDCITKSLIYKPTGEEVLMQGEEISLFSVTQERPWNNEVKLAHPNKRTTYQANYVRREGNKLFVKFEIVPIKAVVEITEADGYLAFKLDDFIVDEADYGRLRMIKPPVAEFRIVQLPVKNREKFGEWLNVSHDDNLAVCVLSTSQYPRIESERRKGYRILTADNNRDIKLKGVGAAIIVNTPEGLMDSIDAIEHDYDLPLGVESRRSEHLNSSIFWVSTMTPNNVDEYIEYCKKGGFKYMLVYYTCMFISNGYSYCGDYDFRPEYPNGIADLKAMIDKVKAAGIIPGFHFLQTHIGVKSRYVTPRVDHRLNLTRKFTLAKPLSTDDTEVYVDQNPEGTIMDEKCRFLRFGGELIYYTDYTTEYPYKFIGCERGAKDTIIEEHPLGLAGGILDLSEFGQANSCYIDQTTDLQDEVARKLAAAYDTGFRFIYFDGSEGTNPPFEFHVPNAQYRVLKALGSAPLFTEGAAKAHFSWHFLSGGNAFDTFAPKVFKEKIIEHPFEEAPRMRCDFTRLNFGWWNYRQPMTDAAGYSTLTDEQKADAALTGTQADLYEFGTSKAAAWDCPVTMMAYAPTFKSHPRTDDIFEVLRRWEDVRHNGWLTPERKELLKKPDAEFILLINESGEYELAEIKQMPTSETFRAFCFERNGSNYVVYSDTFGSTKLKLALSADAISLSDSIGGADVAFDACGDSVIIPCDNRRYLKTSLTKDEIYAAFAEAEVIVE